MRLTVLCSFVAFAAACSAPVTPVPDAGEDHVHEPVTELRFAAKVGAANFACGQSYSLGTPATTYAPSDLRLYVSEIALLTDESERVPFALTTDGTYQSTTVAMLDFEDASGGCTNGTPTTHTTLTGLAPGGHYDTLEFVLGVPFVENHQDATAAAAPLNSSAMFWNWQGGYRFLRADGTTTGLPTGHNVHLGSTGCMPGATPNSVSSCTAPNRVRVVLSGFDAETSVVNFDLAALLGASNLDTNLAMTPPGCMSSAGDTDCGPIFAKLGLPFGSTAAGTQSVFSVVNQ